jgi:hypothetical protein
VVGDLQSEANRRVGLRQAIENRWIEDLEQYHSRYDNETEKNLIAEERSRLFINLTRPKTNAMGARFKDLLFPTDEKNWGIQPTPVPRMTEAAEAAASQARELEQQALARRSSRPPSRNRSRRNSRASPTARPFAAAAAAPGPAAGAAARAAGASSQGRMGQAQRRAEEGRRRSSLMAETMDDQLTECGYQSIKRDQIDWAMKIGTGVTKGPITGDRMRRGWKQKPVLGRTASRSSTRSPASPRSTARTISTWPRATSPAFASSTRGASSPTWMSPGSRTATACSNAT